MFNLQHDCVHPMINWIVMLLFMIACKGRAGPVEPGWWGLGGSIQMTAYFRDDARAGGRGT